MPSPFPGMDPYLEDPALWRGVHHRLITYIADTLSARLPQRYVANIDERLYVVEADRNIYPDTLVKEAPAVRPAPSESNGGVAVATMAALESDPALEVSLGAEEFQEGFVEIRLAGAEGRVVSVIEVLSPTNKESGGAGREQYRAKQRHLLGSPIHLLEIDLLRQGAYTTAAPLGPLQSRARWNYLVSLHRGGRRSFQVWPVTLRQRLPRVRVPLADKDADLVLDVQEMLNQCYDAGHYDRQLDYRRAPVVPLEPTDADWTDALLRERGLRP